MTATNHDDQLDRTMLEELNCTYGVSFSRFHCCGRHGHGCGRHGLWPSWYRPLYLPYHISGPSRILSYLILPAGIAGRLC